MGTTIRGRPGAVGVLALGAVLLGGCYERVVRAEGPTAYRIDTYEKSKPAFETPVTKLAEDVFFGPDEPKPGKRR